MVLSLSLYQHDFVPYHRPILAKKLCNSEHSFCCISKWAKERECCDEKENARETPNLHQTNYAVEVG
jgi:hypothetical protein